MGMEIEGMDRPRHVILMFMAGLVFIAGGSYIGYSQIQAEQETVAVDAVVLESSVVKAAGGGEGEAEYRPEITYRYTYEDQTYTNDNVFVGSTKHWMDRGQASDIVEHYPEGETVTVYVYPDEPSRSYLRSGGQSYFLPVGLVLFGLIPILVSLVGLWDLVT